jgi:hypothetical protein
MSVFNPISGRRIKIGGGVYNDLIRKGILGVQFGGEVPQFIRNNDGTYTCDCRGKIFYVGPIYPNTAIQGPDNTLSKCTQHKNCTVLKGNMVIHYEWQTKVVPSPEEMANIFNNQIIDQLANPLSESQREQNNS